MFSFEGVRFVSAAFPAMAAVVAVAAAVVAVAAVAAVAATADGAGAGLIGQEIRLRIWNEILQNIISHFFLSLNEPAAGEKMEKESRTKLRGKRETDIQVLRIE